MFYIENKRLPKDYILKLSLDSITRELEGKGISLSSDQLDFLKFILSYESKSEKHTKECIGLMDNIVTLQKVL